MKQQRCKRCKRVKSVDKLYYRVCQGCRPGWEREVAERKNRKAAFTSAYQRLVALYDDIPPCELCGKALQTRRPRVNYDRETGLVRGVLCYTCSRYLSAIPDKLVPALVRFLNRPSRLYLDFARGGVEARPVEAAAPLDAA